MAVAVGGNSGGNGGASSGASFAGSPDVAVVCGDTYPQLSWASSSGERTVCTSSFAPARLSQAVCSCGDLGTFGAVRTGAFDSDTQTTAPGAAAVGVNGKLSTPTALIAGSLTVASPEPLALSLLDVVGDLRLGGELGIAGPLSVARDAWFAEAAKALTLVTIARDLHQAPGKILDESISRGVQGQLISEEFVVAPPCRCDQSAVLDWSTIVQSAAAQNDNEAIGLSAEALVAPAQAVAVTLPCGRYYLSAITGSSDIHLRVEGRVALFVDGDVLGSGQLRVELGAAAELDWFVAGRLDFERAVQIGDVARPAALRVYVAGDGQLSVPVQYVFGSLYAPRSDVVLLGKGDFHGSLFGHTVSSVDPISVRYDPAVQRVGDACLADDPPGCNDCSQCTGGRACQAGSCGACAVDTDCCWPHVCNGGRCSAFTQ